MGRRIELIATALVVLALPRAVQAAEIRAHDGAIYLRGDLIGGDDTRLAQRLSVEPTAPTIFLDSQGGEAIAGMKIGAVIRRFGANTALSGDCVSACVFAFVGGVERALGVGQLGFHQIVDIETGAPISPYHPIYFNLTQYIFQTGIEPTVFLQWIGAAPPDEVYYPTRPDLCHARFITDCASEPQTNGEEEQ